MTSVSGDNPTGNSVIGGKVVGVNDRTSGSKSW